MGAVATGIYSAKAAFFDKLLFLQTQGSFTGVTISYDEPPPDAYMLCIYGGGVRFKQDDPLDNYGIMVVEDSSFGVYLRAMTRPATSVRDTDGLVANLATQLVSVLIENSDFGGGHSWRGIGRGQGDYVNTDDETISILSLEMKVGSTFSYRNG